VSDSLFSPSWYRVANLKPRLRSHALVHRHEYRGEVWFVLQDNAAGRSHRFSPPAYRFIGLMDGRCTVQELWEATAEQLGDSAPTQDEVIRLLGQLHTADALLCDVPPDSSELFRRFQKHQSMQWKRRLATPLAIRVPLFDPERFLSRTLSFVQPLFSAGGALIWFLVVLAGAILAGVHWSELTDSIIDRAMTPQNLLLLWFIYPMVKTFHELGHGYAVKNWGGEVHDIGIMFLVLAPVPYVDASTASGFREKGPRMIVGGVGIAVELFLASLALFVWIAVEPGIVRTVAYNVMLIGGISTLFFNGNPLLRFDGYYVLADALEIPNLGSRSNRYLGYLVQRYAFGLVDADSPAHSNWERGWFVLYGIASFIYRMMIMFVIILYIAGKFFAVGVVLAIWAIFNQVLKPMGKGMQFLFSSPKLRRQRGRAYLTTAVTISLIVLVFFVLPAPLWTRAEGVIWPAEQSQVRPATDGVVGKVLVADGVTVKTNDALIQLEDPFLRAQVAVLEAQYGELEARLMAQQYKNRVQAAVIREEMESLRAGLDRARGRAEDLTIRAPLDGIFVVPNQQDLPGRFMRQGEVIAYVVDLPQLTARVAVTQDEIGLVRQRTQRADVMLADYGADGYTVPVLREIPGGTNTLPTPALGTVGGGSVAVDPRDGDGRRTLARVFELELGLPPGINRAHLGARVYARFDHGSEALAFQLYRSLRQLLLRQFGV
jgi:putative peptide zinc metalloprotease protein